VVTQGLHRERCCTFSYDGCGTIGNFSALPQSSLPFRAPIGRISTLNACPPLLLAAVLS